MTVSPNLSETTMIFKFSNSLPDNISSPQVKIISGDQSSQLDNNIYLLHKQERFENYTNAFEIRYEYSCSPFKQAEIKQNLLAVGFEGYFYLYDLEENKNILALEVNGYFGSFYFENDGIYVCDAFGIWRLDFEGNIIWENSTLAIDGVLIREFSETKISGSGEMDPPGGWQSFEIDRKSGVILK
jgi:hypothetical protein